MIRFLLFLISCFSKYDRIQETSVDLSKPIPIYLSTGRSSLLDFPCSIISATAGPGRDVETHIGRTNPKEIHIYLRSSNSQNTNMIVRCDKAVFIFDIFPSKTSHQDYLKIASFYGSPEYFVQKADSVQTSDQEKNSSINSLFNRLIEDNPQPITRYNETYGRGRIVRHNKDQYFFTTDIILKYGLQEEIYSQYSEKYGHGVWITDLNNKNSLFITGKSMELILDGGDS